MIRARMRCKAHRTQVKDMSLEFQIWWRDHQKADAAREARVAERKSRMKLAGDAAAKLSDDEFRALRAAIKAGEI